MRIISDWIEATLAQRSQQQISDYNAIIATDVGLARSENQDRVAALRVTGATNPFVCVALSDGMGGMKDGGPCATAALAAFFTAMIANTRLRGAAKLEAAINASNDEVYRNWHGKGGATLSVALIEPQLSLHVGNVGDSRVYTVDKDWKEIKRVTVDDSLKEAFGGDDRSLVQFIGIGHSLLPRIDRVAPGADTLFVTSDGAHYIDQPVFDKVILKAGEPMRATERLIALARWLGGPDNASVAAIKVMEISENSLKLNTPFATLWSGSSQLHLPAMPTAVFTERQPPLGQPAENPPKTSSQSKKQSKRKIKVPKKVTPEDQLEINISSDETDDASDS